VNESKSWERYAALGGIVFLVLLIASQIASGSTPNTTDSSAKILKYFADNKDGIKVAAFLNGLAAVPILFWVGSLWARLRRTGEGQSHLAVAAVLGLVLTGASQVVRWAVLGTVVLLLNDVSDKEAKFFFVLASGLGSAGGFGLAVLVLATSVLLLRTRVFPVWVGWVGLVDGLVFLVSGIGIASTSDGVNFAGFISFLLWIVWIIALSVLMFRAKEPAPVT
jgi:hypothetical protein